MNRSPWSHVRTLTAMPGATPGSVLAGLAAGANPLPPKGGWPHERRIKAAAKGLTGDAALAARFAEIDRMFAGKPATAEVQAGADFIAEAAREGFHTLAAQVASDPASTAVFGQTEGV